VNERAKYLGHRSFSSQVIFRTHTRVGHGLDVFMDWIGLDWIAANGQCNFMLYMGQASLFRLLNVTQKL